MVTSVCDAVVGDLTAEAVQGAALTFQGVDYIHGSDSLPLGMLGVGDGISDDVFKENLQDAPGLLIDETRDTFHTTSACKTTNSRLGDALNVITQYFAMTLGASFA